MIFALLLGISSTVLAMDNGLTVYVGAGGCDVSDSSCVSPSTKQLHSVEQFQYGSGNLQRIASFNVGGVPSWIHVTGRCLFATLTKGNHVASFAIEDDGSLTLKSNITAGSGFNPVFLSTIGHVLLAANYHGPDNGTNSTGAGVASLIFKSNSCELSEGDFFPTSGHSVNPARQGASHVHSVVPYPHMDNIFFACDLGADAIYTFSLDPDTAKLTLLSTFHTAPGSGPRHIAVNPDLPMIYVVHEMQNFVSSLMVHTDASLAVKQANLSLLPSTFSGFSKSAEIVATKSGRYVFATTRGFGVGTNTVVMFQADPNAGTLRLVEAHDSGVRFPRGCEISPDDQLLFVAGQSSGNVVTFNFDDHGMRTAGVNATGLPTPTTFAFAQ
eukprot:m.22807 g.22807  ORF g.22807 m.22807 type:complete len:384 (+) comp13016_c0_seq1:1-1152(+)